MMNRRAFVATVGAGIVAAPVVGEGQQAKVWRIGVLGILPRSAPRARESHEAFVDELRLLGYREGDNIVIDWRHHEGLTARRREEASSLLQWKPDVIVTISGIDAVIIRETSMSVPIVVTLAGDLVGMGLATSLARPGGNVTGFQMLSPDMACKRLEVLRELVPNLDRLAMPQQAPGSAASRAHWDRVFAELEACGRPFSIKVLRFTAASVDDFDRTFTEMKRERVQAALVPASPLLGAHQGRLAELALRHRLPMLYETKSFVEAGALISYGMRQSDGYRAAARYVDKIVKGAQPAELPIEQPRQFEMVINLKTAKALGLTIPQALLIRADQVIQ
jgi:putative ABC transport system substrate-binding protein